MDAEKRLDTAEAEIQELQRRMENTAQKLPTPWLLTTVVTIGMFGAGAIWWAATIQADLRSVANSMKEFRDTSGDLYTLRSRVFVLEQDVSRMRTKQDRDEK